MMKMMDHSVATARATPFHEGEVRMQRLRNMHEHVMSYAPQFIRRYLPDQHREFYENQPFLVAAALRDDAANDDDESSNSMWATMIFPPSTGTGGRQGGKLGVATSPTPETLQLEGRVAPGDALEGQFVPHRRVGLLGIELETKRRNRVNGHIITRASNSNGTRKDDGTFRVTFAVDQSFGNCPQYITPRQWHWRQQQHEVEGDAAGKPSQIQRKTPANRRGTELSASHVRTVQGADTIFIATGYQGGRGNDDVDNRHDERLGNDASHRGGPPGFLRVVPDSNTILLPDYSGNNHYNSIGNLLLDPRMGMLIPDFVSGSYLQLSGTASVVTDPSEVAILYPSGPGTNAVGAVIVFRVLQVNDMPPGSIPLRFSDPKDRVRLRVASVVQESKDVKSFVLEPLDGAARGLLKTYRAGQYLPVHLSAASPSSATTNGPPLVRTYSLSRAGSSVSAGGPPSAYRISVKRHPLGSASRHLHDRIAVGDVISAEEPAGDFVLNQDGNASSTVVLLSVGIGVTPVLAMLGELVDSGSAPRSEAVEKSLDQRRPRRRNVLWVHGARNGAEHSFREEVISLQELSRRDSSNVNVSKHVVYSQPDEANDKVGTDYDSKGRVDLELVRSLLASARGETGEPVRMSDAEYYLCGPPGFVADMETGLQKEGVAAEQVHSESF